MNASYFDTPTQVLFNFDEENVYGIAYHDKIICACCGGVFELNEVEIIEELEWVDFTEYIR